MKTTIQEIEQKVKTWEENRLRIDKAVTLACTNFTNPGITEDMFVEAKVIRLGVIAYDLHKKVAELEA